MKTIALLCAKVCVLESCHEQFPTPSWFLLSDSQPFCTDHGNNSFLHRVTKRLPHCKGSYYRTRPSSKTS